jgi:hypothetical protein
LKNWIKNIEGHSTSNEVTPGYFGTKGALSLKNENIMCDIYFANISANSSVIKVYKLLFGIISKYILL